MCCVSQTATLALRLEDLAKQRQQRKQCSSGVWGLSYWKFSSIFVVFFQDIILMENSEEERWGDEVINLKEEKEKKPEILVLTLQPPIDVFFPNN